VRGLSIGSLLLAVIAHAAPLHVGTITVRMTPLFDAKAVTRGGFYRVADRLQMTTRESLIRTFLLFHTGDELDEARIRESERNLRQLDFLRSVTIIESAAHDGVIDVVVTTEDAWTTDFNADYSNDGGRAVYEFDVTQKNLFNRGGEVSLRFAHGIYRHTATIEVIDPELFGPYWIADALAADSSDGNEQRASIERPLFSYGTPYTVAASFDHLLQNSRTYDSGFIDAVFRQSHREAFLQGGRVIRSRPAVMTRVLGGVDLLDDSFRPMQGTAPENRAFRYFEAGIDRTRFNFVSLDHVDFGMRKQDFNLGAHAAMFLAVSPATHGHGVTERVRGDGSYGREIGPHSFLMTRATGSMRINFAKTNAILSDDTRLIVRFPTVHPQTFVAHARVDIGWDVDRDVQFLADGRNGLRAYPNFSFEGDRRIILNAEHRWFLGRELMQLFEPGGALFVDSGQAATGGLHLHGFKTDLGVGIRCGISRLDNAMLRFDFAYVLNNSPTSDRGFEISFATIQAF
jgi:hypothetical protein